MCTAIFNTVEVCVYLATSMSELGCLVGLINLSIDDLVRLTLLNVTLNHRHQTGFVIPAEEIRCIFDDI